MITDSILQKDRVNCQKLNIPLKSMSTSSPHLPDLVCDQKQRPSKTFLDRGDCVTDYNKYSGMYSKNGSSMSLDPKPDIVIHTPSKESLNLDDQIQALAMALHVTPTRRNVKPHQSFRKRQQNDNQRHTINDISNLRPLHEPILDALPVNIPKEQRKMLREQILSEVTSKNDIFKAKNGGACIVFDTSSKVNGHTFLSLWRSTDDSKLMENQLTQPKSTLKYPRGNEPEYLFGFI